MLEHVANPQYAPGLGKHEKMVPRVLVAVGGEKDDKKLELANHTLVDWQMDLKKKAKVDEKKECPFYTPGSQNGLVRTFFGKVKFFYDWRWSLADFSAFPGALDGVLVALYAERRLKWVS